jgi:hypothetical protein
MRRTSVIAVAAVAAAILSAGTAVAQPKPRPGSGELLVLSDNGVLSRHQASRPFQLKKRVQINGVARGERLIGIDTRPANGMVYSLSSTGQLYTVDPNSGRATPVGTPIALNGKAIGFDFNPTVDRIRVVTDAGQNLRIVPDTGALAATDTNLAYAANDVAAGSAPQVTAAGYTNSVNGATNTALYGIDTKRGTLVLQGTAPGTTPVVSPNTGQLTTVGRLGLRANAFNGFDIQGAAPAGAFNPRDYKAVAAVQLNLFGFAVLTEVDLATGRARPATLLFGKPVGLTFTT